MVYTLRGRKVLITGGSRGLGAVISESFAREGCSISINYHASSSAASKLAEDLSHKYSIQAISLQADVSDESSCHALVTSTIQVLGGLDIIIANAGTTVLSPFPDLDGVATEDWERLYRTNALSPLFLLRAAKATFSSNPEGGVLLMTSSCAATNPIGSSMAYAVSKAAQLHLMKCLSASQGPKVRVNAITPGLLMTEWGLSFGEEKIKQHLGMTKLGKVGSLVDCAEAFLYLARADTVTGAVVKVDGGVFKD